MTALSQDNKEFMLAIGNVSKNKAKRDPQFVLPLRKINVPSRI